MKTTYDQAVGSRFHIYNSLFLNLPFQSITRTGTLLPLLENFCETGFDNGESPDQIISGFFDNFTSHASLQERLDLLFRFIQYIERQVALFDSVEDASFEQVNDLTGKGTVTSLLQRASFERKEETLKQKLETFGLRVVLTAHPTQFYPGPVLGILNDLEQAIRINDIAQIDLLLQQLGKTAFINKEKPTPYDEAVSLSWFLENVFYHAIPQIIQMLCDGVKLPIHQWKNDKLVVIGFWPGGDRDGNPFVTHTTTLKVAARLKASALKNYHRDIRLLRRRLTFEGIDSLIVEIERKIYNMAFTGTLDYANAEEIVDDLLVVRKKLLEEHDGLFLPLLDTFILKVRLFRFHFASLDIRQDSRKHDAAWKAIIASLHGQKKFVAFEELDKLDENSRIKHLLNLTVKPEPETVGEEFAEEVIRTILAIDEIQRSNGEAACHRYVISNCQSALHVVEVFVLARLLIGQGQGLNLDVVPLFETIDDLANAGKIMSALYQVPEYRAHIRQRGNKQTIMLGFSDGTKDGGYLRANWSIFRAKEMLTAIANEFDVTVVFFDGRGGPPARGGGNTHDFYASLGRTIASEEVQITIQGQTISSNFGKLAACRFNLEQLVSAGLGSSVFESREIELTDDDKELLDELAEEGYKAYLDLKKHPSFIPYLEKVTPLSFFGAANIGSRPVKRGAGPSTSTGTGLKLEDLRAIPFVGSWAMMKQNLPGFYGVGSAIEMLNSRGRGPNLRKLYQKSLFFRTLIGNSMMSLSKSYFPATSYLAKDAAFGEIWNKMFHEFVLSKKQVLDVSSTSELMEANPNIRLSVRLRERIVLPLIAIQQHALINLRKAEAAAGKESMEKVYSKLIIRSMFGIINAARNSA
jgi:phosphoenolpyruvate carboxylase